MLFGLVFDQKHVGFTHEQVFAAVVVYAGKGVGVGKQDALAFFERYGAERAVDVLAWPYAHDKSGVGPVVLAQF
jgi:hypothetical protein